MKTTKNVKAGAAKAKARAGSRVAKVAARARDKVLATGPGKKVAKTARKAVEKLDELAGRTPATRAVRETVKKVAATPGGKKKLAVAKRELEQVGETTKPRRKMPADIKTTSGGKHLSGEVAAKAVRRGAEDFKPKKGKK